MRESVCVCVCDQNIMCGVITGVVGRTRWALVRFKVVEVATRVTEDNESSARKQLQRLNLAAAATTEPASGVQRTRYPDRPPVKPWGWVLAPTLAPETLADSEG